MFNKICLLLLCSCFMFMRSLSAFDAESRFLDASYSKKVSMDFKNAALVDVLKVFSKQSGKNFIAATDIANKSVTLYFDNIPVDEALDRILEANNLTYQEQLGSDVFIVKTKVDPDLEIETRVYALKHASVSTSSLFSTFSSGSSSSSSSSSDTSSSSSSSGSSSATTTSTSGGLLAALQAVMSTNGSIVEDARTNSLVITDERKRFASIEAALAKLDVPVVQILIDVQMLDVSKVTSDKIGIKYGEQPLTVSGGERDHIYPWDQNRLLDKGYEFASAEYRVGTVSARGMTAALNFLRTQTDTRNLARPRILTLNNQTAQIQISTDEAIGATSSESESGNTTTTAERVQTGVFLAVTPQANVETGEILMAVVPRVIQARQGATFAGTSFKDPEQRGTQSMLRIKDGETIIIGGLIREDDSNEITKLPILGDIPLLGGAFRHKSKSGQQRELLIFLTPHILHDEGTKAKLNLHQSIPERSSN